MAGELCSPAIFIFKVLIYDKYMKIFSLSTDNKKNRPNEDFYLISKKYVIFTVADGVSRVKNEISTYPNPSGARLAAEEFCKNAVSYLEKNFKKANLKILRNAFNFADKAIFNLNKRYEINKKLNFLENDYFSTCGVVAFIKEDTLYYGYVGDCGIRIYDKNDFLKLISIDDVAPLEEWRDSRNFKSKKEREIIWRKILRNKPKAPYLTYGVLTGESGAKYYYHFGKIKLNSGNLIFLYSDGFLYFLKQPKIRKLFKSFQGRYLKNKINQFIKNEMKLKKIKKENTETFFDDKTLIAILI